MEADLREASEKILELSARPWRPLDLRGLLARAGTLAAKEGVVTTALTADPDFRDCLDRPGRPDRRPPPLIWTPFPPSPPKATRPVVEPLESGSFRLKWVPWAPVDPLDPPDPQDPLDLSVPVVTPEILDQQDREDQQDQSDLLDQQERRVSPDVMDSLDLPACKDQWANVDLQECRDFLEPKDTGVCRARTEPRVPKDLRVSPVKSESPVPSVSLAQWALVEPVESEAALDPPGHRVSGAATDSPALVVPQDQSDPRDLRASPASQDPKETRVNKVPRVVEAFRVPVEKTVYPDPLVNPVSRVLPVLMVPTERRVPAETWAPRVPPASPDPEDPQELPVTPEWVDQKEYRASQESQA